MSETPAGPRKTVNNKKLIMHVLRDPGIKQVLLQYYHSTHKPEYAQNPCAENLITLRPTHLPTEPWGVLTQQWVDYLLNAGLVFSSFGALMPASWNREPREHLLKLDKNVRACAPGLKELFDEQISPENFAESFFPELLGLRTAEAVDESGNTEVNGRSNDAETQG